jgi:hypothetical protein
MATEQQGRIRVSVEDGVATATVAGNEALMSKPAALASEQLPFDGPATSVLSSGATATAIDVAHDSRALERGVKWKPDRAKVREAFRRHIADRYAVSLTDAAGQALVNEIFAAQNPAKWLLFLSHQTGQLYTTLTLRNKLKGSLVYRSDEQAAALANDLKKVLDTAFESFAGQRTATSRNLTDTEKTEDIKRLAVKYDQQIQLLHEQFKLLNNGREKDALQERISQTAESALVELVRVNNKLSGVAQAQKLASKLAPVAGQPVAARLGKFANYVDTLNGRPELVHKHPYDLGWL